MNYKQFSAVLLLAVSAAGISSAAEIYKWTDNDGNIHYTDKPVAPSSQRLVIESRPTDNAAVQAQIQARLERKSAMADLQAGESDQITPAELRAQALDRNQKCSMYRERLTSFVQSRHLYREDENGERVYLNDAEMDSARERVQLQVEEFCSNS